MRLLLDTDGKINYDEINQETAVQDLLDAIDEFLSAHALPCDACGDSCCKKAWSVEVDNVCVNRLCGSGEAASEFVKGKLILKKNYARQFQQYVLDKKTSCLFVSQANRCTIYERRPIICRLYLCSPRSRRYDAVREVVGAVFLQALVLEERMRRRRLSWETVNRYRCNPAVFARDYDVPLRAIFRYGREEGWLEPEEDREL